jgi:hypothetical protein
MDEIRDVKALGSLGSPDKKLNIASVENSYVAHAMLS